MQTSLSLGVQYTCSVSFSFPTDEGTDPLTELSPPRDTVGMVDCALPSLPSLICGDTGVDEEERRRRRKSTPQDVDDFEADALWGEDGQESRSAYLTWASTHSGYTGSTDHWPTELEQATWQWCRDDVTGAPVPRSAAGFEDRLRISFLLAEHSAGALKMMREAKVIFEKLVKDCAAVTRSKKKVRG